MIRLAILAGAFVLFVTSILSGLMVIAADEVAVIYRFGSVTRTEGSGLAWRLPHPIEQDERIQVTEVRRVAPGHQILLTGDTNLIELDLVAQYTIQDPVAYVLSLDSPEEFIAATATSAVTAQVAQMEVDVLLTTGRGSLESAALKQTQTVLDELNAGIHIEAIELRTLKPPDPVVAAFNDVSSARGDRDTMILSAQSYASRLIPDIRGQAAEQGEQARAAAAQIRARSRANVDRFAGLLPTWKRDPETIRTTLTAEMASSITSPVHIVPTGAEIILDPQ